MTLQIIQEFNKQGGQSAYSASKSYKKRIDSKKALSGSNGVQRHEPWGEALAFLKRSVRVHNGFADPPRNSNSTELITSIVILGWNECLRCLLLQSSGWFFITL